MTKREHYFGAKRLAELQVLRDFQELPGQRQRQLLELLEEFLESRQELRKLQKSDIEQALKHLEKVTKELSAGQSGLKLKVTEVEESVLTFKTKPKGENWARFMGWLIPPNYRYVIGDILEDCAEMREAGCTERRIKFHLVYQLSSFRENHSSRLHQTNTISPLNFVHL